VGRFQLGEVLGLAACFGCIAMWAQIVGDGCANAGTAGLAQLPGQKIQAPLQAWLHAPHECHGLTCSTLVAIPAELLLPDAA